MPPNSKRHFNSWIDGFLEFTSGSKSPAIFRKWGAISTLAAVMQRKTWVTGSDGLLYPNLYVVLIGPPGIGKSNAVKPAEMFQKAIDEPQQRHFIGPTNMSKAALLDALDKAKCKIVRPAAIPPYIEFNSISIIVDELADLIKGEQKEFIPGLNRLYDCLFYEEALRGRQVNIDLKSPQVNLLSATTPTDLLRIMPEGAWTQGFSSRIIFIFSSEIIKVDFFKLRDKSSFESLLLDLKMISRLYGEFDITDEARARIIDWDDKGNQPIPEHPKLASYNARRTAHLVKLCMIASVNRGLDLTIAVEDFELALGWLVEAEVFMPDIFKTGATAETEALDEVWFELKKHCVNGHKLPEHKLIQLLSERVPLHAIARAVEVLEKTQRVSFTIQPSTGAKLYTPGPNRPR